ncbi:carbohydrate binding domain-containing protein [Dasania marina]|uniref:carbohydrate binding domain-containing protein n=1 Tax=Dasania marina TaxID=471499 RepID=UPI0030DCF4A0
MIIALYKSRATISLILLSLLLLLYIASPQGIEPRSIHQLWNLGHLALFFSISAAILLERRQQHSDLRSEAIEALLYPLLFGLLIELIQPLFTRTADISDLAKNGIGSLLAFCWLSRHLAQPKPRSLLLKIFSLLVFLFMLKPYMLSRYDEHLAKQSFPLLSDVSSHSELARFQPIGIHTQINLAKQAAHLPSPALAIQINNKERYSGVSLAHFPGDWRGYQQLKLSLYLDGGHSQQLTLRIHDRLHPKGGNEYNDRFNQKITLSPGWNHLSINLAEVAQAPVQRAMDMANIIGLSLFMIEATPQTLWLDDIYLQ